MAPTPGGIRRHDGDRELEAEVHAAVDDAEAALPATDLDRDPVWSRVDPTQPNGSISCIPAESPAEPARRGRGRAHRRSAPRAGCRDRGAALAIDGVHPPVLARGRLIAVEDAAVGRRLVLVILARGRGRDAAQRDEVGSRSTVRAPAGDGSRVRPALRPGARRRVFRFPWACASAARSACTSACSLSFACAPCSRPRGLSLGLARLALGLARLALGLARLALGLVRRRQQIVAFAVARQPEHRAERPVLHDGPPEAQRLACAQIGVVGRPAPRDRRRARPRRGWVALDPRDRSARPPGCPRRGSARVSRPSRARPRPTRSRSRRRDQAPRAARSSRCGRSDEAYPAGRTRRGRGASSRSSVPVDELVGAEGRHPRKLALRIRYSAVRSSVTVRLGHFFALREVHRLWRAAVERAPHATPFAAGAQTVGSMVVMPAPRVPRAPPCGIARASPWRRSRRTSVARARIPRAFTRMLRSCAFS